MTKEYISKLLAQAQELITRYPQPPASPLEIATLNAERIRASPNPTGKELADVAAMLEYQIYKNIKHYD